MLWSTDERALTKTLHVLLRMAFGAVVGGGGVWMDGKQSDKRTCFCRRAMVERSSSGDSSSATLLILAGCNSAWKVWPGKRGRGSWEREGKLSGRRIDRKTAVRESERKKGIWLKNVLELAYIKRTCVHKCVTVWVRERETETSPGYGGCTRTCHHSPAVLEAQMEVCLWPMLVCVCTYAYSDTHRHCRRMQSHMHTSRLPLHICYWVNLTVLY